MNNHHSEILNIYYIKTQEFEALFSKQMHPVIYCRFRSEQQRTEENYLHHV